MSDVVLPGDLIADKPIRSNYTYIENGKTYSSILGLMRNNRVIPLQGPYIPKENDTVIGIIEDIKMRGFTLFLNTGSSEFLSERNTARNELGDILQLSILHADDKGIVLKRPHKLSNGILVNVSPVKVPRLLGKNNSMLDLLKDKTGCHIVVGKNGLVWISNDGNYPLAKKAIEKIINEAHISGLTDRMEKYLSR